MSRPSVVIVSPALAAANNGNWQTAHRWREMLGPRFDVRITKQWRDASAEGDAVMLALHARRSADSIEAWVHARGERGLAVVLTGTDLYQDIAVDPQAQRSLQLANRLVVLQELGVAALPAAFRDKSRVIHASTPSREALPKPDSVLDVVLVGHLRAVKSPQTLFAAARLLAGRDDIRIEHIGDALEPGLADQARATETECANYRWTGGLPHAETRERIRRAHVLLSTSAMEGGAHVIMEAVRSATAVLASGIPGNVGMLGADYAGYFPVGDASALAEMLLRCRRGQADPGDGPSPALLAVLGAQCALRAPLFAPDAEQAALEKLVAELMDSRP